MTAPPPADRPPEPVRRVLVPASASARPPLVGGVVRALAGQTMGTTWSLRLVAVRSVDLASIQRGVERRLGEVVEQMSHWEPDSALSRFNRADAGSWHRLPAHFMHVLRCGLSVAEQSGGAFDPAAGALVDAWGFGATPRYDEQGFAPPDASALHRARAAGGWRRLAVDEAADRVLQPGGVRLDLSAIAKGFAVDHVAGYLHELGIADRLIEIGGELRGDGLKPDGQPWWVALEYPGDALSEPRGPSSGERARTVVALHELSVATSGDYRRFHDAGGRRRPHTIDPRRGEPIENAVASVTVLHRECMLADAWSTALGVLGADDGLVLADALGLAASFIVRTQSPEAFDAKDPFVMHDSDALRAMTS